MGSRTSNRWGNYRKKRTVESCVVLSIRDLIECAGLAPEVHTITGLARCKEPEEVTHANMRVEIRTSQDSGWVQFGYQYNGGAFKDMPLRYRVRLVTVRPRPSILHWYFICPGETCGGNRVSKLYLRNAAPLFLCRKCHDLVYKSSQTHDKTKDPYRKMPWFELAAWVNSRMPMPTKALWVAYERTKPLSERKPKSEWRWCAVIERADSQPQVESEEHPSG